MPSERIQRQIDRFLDGTEDAASRSDWTTVKDRAENVLTLDPAISDAVTYLSAAERRLEQGQTPSAASYTQASARTASPDASPPAPTSFANGRYQVKRFLVEGGKKKVYLPTTPSSRPRAWTRQAAGPQRGPSHGQARVAPQHSLRLRPGLRTVP